MRSRKSKSSSAPALVAAFLLVVAVATGAFLLLDGDADPDGSPEGDAVVLSQPAADPTMALPDVIAPVAPPERLEAAPVAPMVSESILDEDADPDAPLGRLEGQCVDPEQRPVEGVLVRITRGSPIANMTVSSVRDFFDVTAITGADGRFALEGVPAGKNYMLVGDHDEFATSTVQGLSVRPEASTDGIVLVMRAGAVIGGVVTTLSESPIAEARVELYDTVADARLTPEERRPFKIVFSDRLGRFAFTHVAMASLKVRVVASGYETQTLMISSALKASPEDQELAFRLADGRALAGRVLDETGRPVVSARVEAFALKRDYQGNAIATSDAGGYFLLDGMSTEQAYQVRCTARGYSDQTKPSVMVNDGDLIFELGRRLSVEGVVRNTAGAPVTEFSIALMRAIANRDPALMNDVRDFRDAQGRFAFDNLEPGSYAFEARADGYAPSQSLPFEVQRGSTPPMVEITVLRGGTLKGVVVDSSGKPLQGALVQLNENNFVDTPLLKIFASMSPTAERPQRTRTNAKGRFVFRNVAPGVYQISVKHHTSAPFQLNDLVVVDDDTGTLVVVDDATGGNNPELRLEVPMPAVISGHALDQNRIPLPFVRVQLAQTNGNVDSVTTDTQGAFRFDNLSGGDYQLTLFPDRKDDAPLNPLMKLVYAQKSLKKISLRDGQELTGVEIYLVETN